MAVSNIAKIDLNPSRVDPVGSKSIEAASVRQERGFGFFKYLSVATAVAALAAAFFSLEMPIATLFTAMTVWFIFSSIVAGAHRVTEGTWIGKPIRLLYAIVMETNANAISTALFPLTLFSRYHAPRSNLKGRPILMVNGYLGFAANWHYQRNELEKAGLGPIYTINMGTGRSIKTYAAQLRDKVIQIQKETGRKDLVLIGHSRGGLISSYFATHLAESIGAKVTDVISIGSPFNGTPFACFAIGYDGQEMRSGSAFQRELRRSMKDHPEIRFSYIGSEADGAVHVNSALPDKEAKRQLLFKDLGHTSMLLSSRTADQNIAWIKEGLQEIK